MIRKIFTLIGIFVIFNYSFAQVNLQVGGGFGLTSPLSDYKGSTIEYYAGKNYGLSSGYNVFAKARFGLLGTSLVGEVGYTALSNSGNSEPGKGKVEVKHNNINLKLGPELQFSIPELPMKPYLGGNLIITIFSGETSFNGVAEVPSGTHKMKSTARVGINGNLGVIVKLNPLLSLDVNANYNILNLVGKSWNSPALDKVKRIDSYLYLNDDKDPLGNLNTTEHFIAKSRSIHTIGLSVGLMFGI